MLEQIMAWVTVVTGAGLTLFGLLRLWGPDPRRHWTPTLARVVRSGTLATGEGYQPDVEYRYTVDGREYQSSAIAPAIFETSSNRQARAVSERYPVGGEVVAYVDPADPTKVFLNPRMPRVMPIAFMAGGMVALWFGLTHILR